MAFKRLMKEWECWDQKSPNRAMEEFGTFDEEQQLWKLHPQPLAEEKVDYLSWEAELRVSSGPFRGASFVYILNYPRDYPFKPPTLKVAFTGFPVAYQDIQEGWYVYMVPPRSTSGQRVAGAVTDAKEGGMTVQWKQQMCDFDEEDEVAAQVDVISQSYFESHASPVLGQSKDGVVYHPLLDARGTFCTCGISQKWSPHFTVLTCLSFARAAIEDPNPEDSTKPVPPGSSNEMCFCTTNPAACKDFTADPSQWHHIARRRFFTEHGVVPLICSTSATEPGEIWIQCSSLAGSQLGEVQIDSQRTMEDLEAEIQRSIPLKEGGVAWKLVLPNGNCLSELLRYRSVGSIFDLH